MKDKKRKNNKAEKDKTFQQIYELEKLCQQGKDLKTNFKKMEELMSSFSLAELIELDTFITKKFI